MRRVEEPTAGRSTLPKLICPAGSDLEKPAVRRGSTMSLPTRMAAIAPRLAAAISAWRECRRARRRLESWLTMDPRTLADIGLRPADVQAMVYAGAGSAQLAERGGRWTSSTGRKVIDAPRRAPQLRVVAGDHLDAAA
jgi:uncharacterized protein YjiS (DUF1127 family)